MQRSSSKRQKCNTPDNDLVQLASLTADNERSSNSDESSAKVSSDSDSSTSEISRLDNSWISATSTYNYMMKDPLLDWLKHHHGSFTHRHRQYRNIVNKSLEDSKSAYNFTSYIMEQGVIFEKKVMKLLTKKFESKRIATIHGELDPRNPEKVRETLEAMKSGIPIIHSGVLHNPTNKTFGIPDLLVRSDWMKFLVKEAPLSAQLEKKSAPKLEGSRWHYRVVDIKFTGLLLRADATHLLNAASFPAYKAQLLIYNWALGELQGYTPDQVYILGRRWRYTSKGETYTNNTCFDKFGIIDYRVKDRLFVGQTKKALKWIREVRSDTAADWNITKYPLSRWELYPNMCNSHDYPWHTVKEEIANETKELTSLWMVGPKNRELALEAGISRWTDPKCTAAALGIHGQNTSKILSALININQSDKVKIAPEIINNNLGTWQHQPKIEFFVDFETCNGVVSSIKHLPEAKNDTIVFMIGVGYIDPDTRQWVSRDFTVNRLTFSEEARICQEFSDFIRSKGQQYGVKKPRCIHWARAEDIMWTDAVERHDPISEEWKSYMWDWLDLLMVFKDEPIVIHGCMSFGLKDVAAAMKQHGFIQTSWDKNSACVDGQSAMVAARKAHNQARQRGISMKKLPIMEQILQYNKVDVRVLYEIITYLRLNHLWGKPYKLAPTKNKRTREDNASIASKRGTNATSSDSRKRLSPPDESEKDTPLTKRTRTDSLLADMADTAHTAHLSSGSARYNLRSSVRP